MTVEVGLPYETVLEQAVFPDGSALRRAMDATDIAESGRQWPLIATVTLSYGMLHDRWMKEKPSGFHLRMRFVVTPEDEFPWKEAWCFIPSGLDPPKKWNGEVVELGHLPMDTMGEPRSWPGSEAWSADASEVAKFKAMFLRPK